MGCEIVDGLKIEIANPAVEYGIAHIYLKNCALSFGIYAGGSDCRYDTVGKD